MSGKKDSKHINLAGVSSVGAPAGKPKRRKVTVMKKVKSRDAAAGRVKKARGSARSRR